MKTIYITRIMAAGLFTLLLGACNNQLDLPSDGRISREEMFSNRDAARGYLASVYVGTSSSLTLAQANYADETEDANLNIGANTYVRWYAANVSSRDFGSYNKDGNPWGSYYGGIRKANTFLKGIEGYEGLAFGTDRSEVEAWKAQAHTLRAFYYLQLIKRWGSVPYFTEEIPASHNPADDSRSSFPFVATKIIEDCRAALAAPDYEDVFSFSWKIFNYQGGIMHRALAYAIMSEAALYAASPLYAGTEQDPAHTITWDDAMDVCGEALYQCLSNDYSLFDIAPNPADAHNAYAYYFLYNPNDLRVMDKETIYQWCSMTTVWKYAGLPTTPGQDNAGPCPLQEMVDSYEVLSADGTTAVPVLDLANPYTGGDHTKPNINPAAVALGYNETSEAMYQNRDPRFYASIYYNGATRYLNDPDRYKIQTYEGGLEGISGTNKKYTRTGYYMRKCSNWRTENGNQTGDGSLRSYRLAGLYLNFAEAAYNSTGDPYRKINIGGTMEMSAVDAVNAIRERAGMPALPTGLTAAQFELRYRNERRVELAFEGHRYYDVRRWKILDQSDRDVTKMVITKDAANNLTYTRTLLTERQTSADKFLLYPIDEGELRKITSAGGSAEHWQNPGW